MLLQRDTPNPQIKIIDFGLAQKLEEGVPYRSLCGTPQYIGMALGRVGRSSAWEREAEAVPRLPQSPTAVEGRPCSRKGTPTLVGTPGLSLGEARAAS